MNGFPDSSTLTQRADFANVHGICGVSGSYFQISTIIPQAQAG
jgi:hypothetical protein